MVARLMMPFVSVIMPAFNAAAYVGQAIESVLSQTHEDLELIVVDDGSEDQTYDVASSYRDPRVRLIHQQNSGVAQARNAGIEAAEGELVAFLDADDKMVPDRIERQVAYLAQNADVDVIDSRIQYISGQGAPVGVSELRPYHSVAAFRRYMASGGLVYLRQTAVMARRRIFMSVDGFNSEYFAAEDFEFWNRVAESGFTIVQIPDVLTMYRLHPASIMSKHARRVWEMAAWAEWNVLARRSGHVEQAFTTYMGERHKNVLTRLNFARNILGNMHYGRFTRGVSNRQPSALYSLCICMITKPLFTIARIYKQLSRAYEPKERVRWT